MNGRTSKLWRIAVVAGLALLGALAVAVGVGSLAAAAAPAAGTISVDGSYGGCVPTAGQGDPYGVVYCEIGDAVFDSTDGDVINVAAGTYNESVSFGGKTVTVNGAGEGSTIVDGGGSGRVINIYSGSVVTLTGMTIQHGNAGPRGGGIYNQACTVTLTSVTLYDNYSNTDGGGIGLVGGRLTLSDTTVISNGTVGFGGGIYTSGIDPVIVANSAILSNTAQGHGGGILSAVPMTVTNCTIAGNTMAGSGQMGGGLTNFSGNTTVLISTTIRDNACTGSNCTGGGLGNLGYLYVRDCVVEGNRAQEDGGGIHNSGGELLIEDSVVRGNQALEITGYGGGLFNNSSATLDRVTVSGNTSGSTSGGIHNQELLTMTNVTVSGNEAGTTAGGLDLTGGATATLVNCSIVNNTVGTGGNPGGLLVYATVHLSNTLVAYNDSPNCAIGGGAIDSYGYNLEDDDTCDLGATGDITDTDPLLLPLGNYGGPWVGAAGSEEPMLTHLPGRNSPAIDAGGKAACPAVDQRGVARPVDGDGDSTVTCDIGAVEFDLVNGVFLPLVLRSW